MSTSVSTRFLGSRAEGLCLVLFTACSWGASWPQTKFLLGELPPFTMRTFCGTCGCLFAFAVALVRREHLIPPRDQWGRLFLFAMLNYGVFIVFSTEVQVYLPASEAIVLTYTLPIWASLLAWPLLGERPSWRQYLALMLAIGGVALLVGVGSAEARWQQLPGVAMGLTAAVLFGLGTVLAKRTPLALPPATSVAWQVGFGTAVLAILAAFETADWSRVTPAGWACITYVATMPMTIAYLAWFRALRLVPASMAATTVLVSPMVGVLGGTLVLGEPLGQRQVVALGLTLAGVALAARG
ncbi:MAG TPA: EamA family transporter [Acetobacteraceae bacterium]|nr:EamA family transporter [Acetobacteraceae bacterium]